MSTLSVLTFGAFLRGARLAAGLTLEALVERAHLSREAIRGYVAALFKGTPEEKPEQYTSSSPSTYAEQVSAPLLIFQGRHDTRTPSGQMERYEAQMKALGKEIEVRWFEAGHLAAFGQVEQAIEHQEWMLRFAPRVLGKR